MNKTGKDSKLYDELNQLQEACKMVQSLESYPLQPVQQISLKLANTASTWCGVHLMSLLKSMEAALIERNEVKLTLELHNSRISLANPKALRSCNTPLVKITPLLSNTILCSKGHIDFEAIEQ